MSKQLRSLALLCAAITLLTGCIPFGSNAARSRLPQDPRFAEFTYETDGEIKVQERTIPSMNGCPGLVQRRGTSWQPTSQKDGPYLHPTITYG